VSRLRCEDLGRLAVLLERILELPIWELYHGRNKDFVEYFDSLDKEKQWDLLHDFIYGIDNVKDKILDCRSIALGTDDLNDPPYKEL